MSHAWSRSLLWCDIHTVCLYWVAHTALIHVCNALTQLWSLLQALQPRRRAKPSVPVAASSTPTATLSTCTPSRAVSWMTYVFVSWVELGGDVCTSYIPLIVPLLCGCRRDGRIRCSQGGQRLQTGRDQMAARGSAWRLCNQSHLLGVRGSQAVC